MQLRIALGNSKLGNIPNISMLPGESCAEGVRCYSEGCYAKKFVRLYPSVATAWSANLQFYREAPEQFFREWKYWCSLNVPPYFRVGVAGDFPDEMFLQRLRELALDQKQTKFLCFTKRYDYNYEQLPDNLKIVLSIWPTMPVPENKYNLPVAWLEEDPRRDMSGFYLVCPGHCGKCRRKCWDLIDNALPVVFPRH